MKIKTERLTLVPISETFLDSACAYAMNADNARLMVYLPKDSRDEVREFLRSAGREWQKPQPDICEFAVLLNGGRLHQRRARMDNPPRLLGQRLRC